MNHKKVYNQFQINLIVFYIACVTMIPLLCIISYLFDFHLYTSTNTIMLTSAIVLLVFFVIGLIYILLSRDFYERRLKPSYQREFTFVMSIWALGVLGVGIMFMYFGGPDHYVPHVIIPTAIVTFTGIYALGDKYFNISLLRR